MDLDWVIGVIGIVVTIVVAIVCRQEVQLRKMLQRLDDMQEDIQRVEEMIEDLSEQQEYIKNLIHGSRSLQVTMVVLQCMILLAVISFIIWKFA